MLIFMAQQNAATRVAANAAGGVGAVVASPPTAIAIGRARYAAALPGVTVTSPTAHATGRAQRAAALAAITVATPTAAAFGRATRDAMLPALTAGSPMAVTVGAARVSASLPELSAAAPFAVATGGASVDAELPTVATYAPGQGGGWPLRARLPHWSPQPVRPQRPPDVPGKSAQPVAGTPLEGTASGGATAVGAPTSVEWVLKPRDPARIALAAAAAARISWRLAHRNSARDAGHGAENNSRLTPVR